MEIPLKENALEKQMFSSANVIKKTPTKEDEGVFVIILCESDDGMAFYKTEICGKKICDWVGLACSDYDMTFIDIEKGENVLQKIKPLLREKTWTLVLYGDTPLVKKKTIREILAYARAKDCLTLNLVRGHVFKTDYVRGVLQIQNETIDQICETDFCICNSIGKIGKVTKVIRRQILKFHMENGVIIEDCKNTHIESDVIIEAGTVIEPFNVIKGKTYIAKNVKIESFCRLENCYIGENAVVSNCVIKGKKIPAGSQIMLEKLV